MGIAVTRKDLVGPGGSVVPQSKTDVTVRDQLFVRTYRIDSEHTPLMIITEWFLTSLTPFLSSA